VVEKPEVEEKTIWHKLEDLPVSSLFLLVILSMCLTTLYPLGLPVPITKMSKDTFDAVNTLPQGSYIWIYNGYGSGTLAVHEPGLIVILRHAIQKGFKIILFSDSGPIMLFPRVLDAIKPDLERAKYVYGKDWVYLYIPGGEPVWATVFLDVWSVVMVEKDGIPFEKLPLMVEIKERGSTYKSMHIVYCQTAGSDVVDAFVRQVNVRYQAVTGVRLIFQILELMVPPARPYYEAGNTQGIMNGGLGAGEYETLLGRPGGGLKVTDLLSLAQLITIAYWAVGNVGFMMRRRITEQKRRD